MISKYESLKKLYRHSKNKNKYASDSSEIIKFSERDYGNVSSLITLIKIDNNYLIFLNLIENKKLVFNGLLFKETYKNYEKYQEVVNNQQEYSLDYFLNNYYEELNHNLS